jgi:hypothetical protein
MAPDSSRTAVKLAASMLALLRANLHRSELAANASMATLAKGRV